MRKCLLWAVILFLAMHPLRLALADSPFYQDGAFSYTLTDEGAVLRDWQGWPAGDEQPNLLLPDTLGGHPLIGIGAYAMGISYQFDHRNRFRIVLPEGVRYLEENAFDSCCNATMLVLPSTLQQVGEGFLNVFAEVSFPNGSACFSCENGFLLDLRSNTLLYAAPSSYDYPLPSVTRLGNHCLDNWLADRTDVILPPTLTSIGAVFYDLPELKEVTLPDSVITLDSHCFFATGLNSIQLPPGITEIPAYCFAGCDLTSIEIPEGVTRIGEYAFLYNWNLTTDVILPKSVQFVGYGAFPEEARVVAASETTHFETPEEYALRCP